MSKIIEKLVISTVEPENKYVGWLKEDRIFITTIKGENVNEADWREATEAEKLTFQQTQEDIPQQEI